MDELAGKIESEIRNQGPISFARFMELGLYCPVYGYYEKEGDIIGREGDYYTSVSVGNLFGRLLAWQFCDWLSAAETGVGAAGPGTRPEPGAVLQLVEGGAHRGALAKDILKWFRGHRPELFDRLQYWIVEPSALRRQWQQHTLASFSRNTRWVGQFSEVSGNSADPGAVDSYMIIFANELLDAMPVHRLGWDAKRKVWFEWGVTVQADQFAWIRMPLATLPAQTAATESPSELQNPARILQWLLESLPGRDVESQASGGDYLSSAARLLEVLPDGFTIEVSPAAAAWWRTAAAALRSGKLVAIDYGYTFDQFLVPHRATGTLRTYRRHQPGGNPLQAPGLQDITADVNFSLLQSAGESLGLNTDCFVTQSQFLTGILGRVWKACETFGPWASPESHQLKTLTHPDHLGRAFKVLVQSRQVVTP